jgi:hypothetical protein
MGAIKVLKPVVEWRAGLLVTPPSGSSVVIVERSVSHGEFLGTVLMNDIEGAGVGRQYTMLKSGYYVFDGTIEISND